MIAPPVCFALNSSNSRHSRANAVAQRRLQRLDGTLPAVTAHAVATESPAASRTQTAHTQTAHPHDKLELAGHRTDAASYDVHELLEEFQRGVEDQLAGDAQTHYDLGMAYQEMGLHKQAVEAFRVAERDEALRTRALEMVGRCLVAQGLPGEAAFEFRRALDSASEAGERTSLRVEYIEALAGSGDAAGARAALAELPADVSVDEATSQRIDSLRGTLGLA